MVGIGKNMKYETRKHSNKQGSCLKRCAIPILGILFIVLIMAAIKFIGSPQASGTETMQEELPIPEIKEQGEPELTKLNPDSQVKEGW